MTKSIKNTRKFNEFNDINKMKIVQLLKQNKKKIIDLWYPIQFDSERIDKYNISNIPNLEQDWISKNYLAPLLELLISYIEFENKNYLYVYLDERIRYVPYKQDLKEEYLEKIINLEKKEFVAKLDIDETIIGDFDKFYNRVHSTLLCVGKGNGVHLLSVGDCLMNETRVFLHPDCRNEGIALDMGFLYFSATQKEDISVETIINYIENNPVDLISLSFFTYSGLPFYSMLMNNAKKIDENEKNNIVNSLVSLIEDFLSKIRKVSHAPFLIHNVGGLLINNEGGYISNQIRKNLPFISNINYSQKKIIDLLNTKIKAVAEHTENTILIDEESVVKQEGYRSCIKQILPQKIGSALFHTSNFGSYIANQYKGIIADYLLLHKIKVVLVDFDNTLWEGVMGDGPVIHKKEYQYLLKSIKNSGVVLVAVSKNDPESVRWDEMILKKDDFVLTKINWNLKAQNIEEAGKELNLGLDTFLLLDDNPVERELVQTALPEVKVMDSLQPETWTALKRMLKFPNTGSTEEDKKRTEMYRGQALRKIELKKEYDYPSMMAMLNLKAKFGKAEKQNIERIHELINRTNQFNATTIRYGKNEIIDMLESSNHNMYITELEDKFGGLGIVGLVIVEKKENKSIIDTFIMSCRAMGFGLEQLMLRLLLEREDKDCRIVGRIIETDRNMPVRDIYEKNGFDKINENEWIIEDMAKWPEKPEWFKVEYYKNLKK